MHKKVNAGVYVGDVGRRSEQQHPIAETEVGRPLAHRRSVPVSNDDESNVGLFLGDHGDCGHQAFQVLYPKVARHRPEYQVIVKAVLSAKAFPDPGNPLCAFGIDTVADN